MKIFLVIIALSIAIIFFSRKKNQKERYAIQNVKTNKNIRPYKANSENDNKIILYDSYSWKCMTWDLEKVGNSEVYNLKNRYTDKTFQASKGSKNVITLVQETLNGSEQQNWEFIKNSENQYLIKLENTNLYITITSDSTNSDIALLQFKGDSSQLWRLKRQNPLL